MGDTTLTELRQDVWELLGIEPGEGIQMERIDKAINDEIRYLTKEGKLLKESAIGGTVANQERYDLKSALIWIADKNPTDSGAVINEGAVFAAGDVTLTVDDGTKFTENQYAKIDNEIIKVTGIAANDLTVTRGQFGTTDAAHDDGSTIYIAAALNILKITRVDYDDYEIDKSDESRIRRVTI